MPEYLLVTQRTMIRETCIQAADPQEAWALAEAESTALDITAFALVNSAFKLYEANVALTKEQVQAAIAELITRFGYEDITKRILEGRQKTIAEYMPEGYQDQEYLCVLYKAAAGPFYCSSSQQLVLKLMEERACNPSGIRSDRCLDEVYLAGSTQDYDCWKAREFQGKTYISVVRANGK